MKKNEDTDPALKRSLDGKLTILAAEEKWDEVVKLQDHLGFNNERKHKSWRDDMDITIVDRDLQEDECLPVA